MNYIGKRQLLASRREMLGALAGLAAGTASAGTLPLTGAGGAGAAGVPVTGDPIGLEVLSASPTRATGRAATNGRVFELTFKGMVVGGTLDPTKISFTVSGSGFDDTGAVTTRTRTISCVAHMKRLVPQDWANATYAVGDQVTNNGTADKGLFYRCTTAGTSTTIPSHTSGTASPGGAAAWLFLGKARGNASTDPGMGRYEHTSGSDVIIVCVPSGRIFAGETITAINIAAGAYNDGVTTSRACTSLTICPVTNSSTLAYPKPHAHWVSPTLQIVDSTLHIEAMAVHPYGRDGRTLACMKFVVRDQATQTVQSTTTVTSMGASTLVTGGNICDVYKADISTSGLSTGDYYIELEAYPFLGDAWKSATSGAGSATPSSTSVRSGNTDKRLQFRKDATMLGQVLYAAVDPSTGVDGAQLPQTTENAARAAGGGTPFATLVAAATALANRSSSQYGRNDCANHVIVMEAGTYNNGWGGTSANTIGLGKGWLTVRPATGVSKASVIWTPSATNNNKRGYRRVIYQGYTANATSSAAVFDMVGGSAGTYLAETRFEDMAIDGDGTQAPVSRSAWTTFLNCQISDATAIGTGSSAGTNVCALIAGCTISGKDAKAVNYLSNIWTNGARPTQTNTGSVHTDDTTIDAPVLAYNTWPACTLHPQFPDGTSWSFGRGLSWFMNHLESNDVNAKGWQISADGSNVGLPAMPEVYHLHNTTAGDGPNLCYAENGDTTTALCQKDIYGGYCMAPDWNQKSDLYTTSTFPDAGATGKADEYKVGNVANRYWLDNPGNCVYAPDEDVNRYSNVGEIAPTLGFLGANGGPASAAKFVDDKSKQGTNTGNGDYRVSRSNASPALDLVPVGGHMAPRYLDGASRSLVVAGPAGAWSEAA